ncbi:DNA-binding transcriptional regulator, XRE-family HTH domain [Alteribacillus persepolensis]|uniref:DNA-binding transcriptional regulator, XRE-family HTH domain n=1 Tax=Alteribacillus persepolensis TaxID=568899 RepID=A0A1G8IFZ5_9BACI|nr:helix-turn-helix domain-containing protein [Alteribacillus persepolensis]SDI17826.1 DNA-binding transcriptional regulator, XRE-family HTH domain [Alteribacillus persepolensis]
MLKEQLVKLRKNNKKTQQDMADILGITRPAYTAYERGTRNPDYETLQKIADFFDVSTDYLLGRTDKNQSDWNAKLPELTDKDERDIQKELQEMIDGLNSKDGYASFDGRDMSDMDEEDKELLINSLETSLRLAKRMAKQKFTPKKYRNEDID